MRDKQVHDALLHALVASRCPDCNTPFTVEAAANAIVQADAVVNRVVEDAKKEDGAVRVHPLFPLYCERCEKQWQYDIHRDSFTSPP